MRKLLTKIVSLLDGTPAVYGERQSGQSVVELALITPILIVLLAGLVEIGWFANNYLNLLDVTRAGARRGAVLQDTKAPLFWDNVFSYVPNVMLPAAYQTPNSGETGTDEQRFFFRFIPTTSNIAAAEPVISRPGLACDEDYGTPRFFYNEVICTMITTMDPLALDPDNGVDDIVISGFAVQRIDAQLHPTWLPGYDANIPQMVVVGRYPTNANECNFALDAGTGTAIPILDAREARDPFDIDRNDARTVGNGHTAGTFTEIGGYDSANTAPEKQVGFSLYGNHKLEGFACVGSEWTMQRVEDLMNLANYDLTDNTDNQRNSLPSQGIIVAEVFWEHEMLLKIPLLSPVFTAVGDPDGRMIVNVWAAFPLSSIEPHIFFCQYDNVCQ